MTDRSFTLDGIALQPDHRIGGAWVDAPQYFDAVSPIDNRLLGKVAMGTPDDAVAAIQAAAAAFPAWAGAGADRRADALNWLAEEIEARHEAFALLECLDTGALLSDLRAPGGVRAWAGSLRRGAAMAQSLQAAQSQPPADGGAWVHHRPAGVCAVLLPAVGALATALWRMAGALAAGNTVVLKVSEYAPLAAALLADVVRAAEEAGLPGGVINIVHGPGHTVGAQLLADPGLARVAFTGRVATGRWVAQVAGATGLPVSLELGARGALLVLPGADVAAVQRAAAAMLRHAGQDCTSARRLIVHHSLMPGLADALVAQLQALQVGDPRDAATELGPVLTDDIRARVLSAVDHAQVAGARVRCGGRGHERGGLYLQPTLVDTLPPRSPLVTGSADGPVLTIQSAASEDEAVVLANEVPGMVNALVFGEPQAARRCAQHLRSGQVWINRFGGRDWAAPWGGVGHAGIGRTGGRWGFDFYCDVQAIHGAGDEPDNTAGAGA